MTTWVHSRKGLVEGDVVRSDGPWVWVRLTGEHRLRWMSEYNRGLVNDDGEVMCFRRSLLNEVTA